MKSFDYLKKLIFFEIEIDNQPARILFDTGAGISCIDKSFCEKHNISSSGEFIAHSSARNPVTIQFAEDISLRLGNYNISKRKVGILDFFSIKKRFKIGHFDGILACDMLLDIPLTINYPEKTFAFEKNISYKYSKIPLEIVSEEHEFSYDIFVELLLEKKIPVQVELDTGGPDFRLHEKYLKTLNIKDFKEIVAGDVVKKYKVKVAELNEVSFLSDKSIAINKVHTFFEKLNKNGVIGNCLLENYTVVFDLQHSQMFLKR